MPFQGRLDDAPCADMWDMPDMDLEPFIRIIKDVWGSSLVQGSGDMQVVLKILARRVASAYPKYAKQLDFNERG